MEHTHDIVDDYSEELSATVFLTYVLPGTLGTSCAREWAEERPEISCGCPSCLRKNGLVLTWHVNDWNGSGDMKEQWRKRIVSRRIAQLCPHLICDGYEPSETVEPTEDIGGIRRQKEVKLLYPYYDADGERSDRKLD